MWHSFICLCILCTSAFTADVVDLPWESWAAKAKVGDFVVRKCSGGVVMRDEVTTVAAGSVTVKETMEVNGSKTVQVKRYVQKLDRPAGNPVGAEVDLKETDDVELKVDGKVVKAKKFAGMMVTDFAHTGKKETARKLAKYEKVVSDSVPFGGVLKEFIAEEDGIAFDQNGGKQLNKRDTLTLLTEVVQFGNVKDGQATSK